MGLPVRRAAALLGLALGGCLGPAPTPVAREYPEPARLEWVDPARCVAPCSGPVAGELVGIDALGRTSGDGSLRFAREAQPALADLLIAARDAGFAISVVSPYRTYDEQATLYAGAQDIGRAARPGHSEHELGEAVDLDTSAAGYAWLDANAPRFGFVQSYPELAQKTTGFIHEWWHFRYVGTRVAQGVAGYGTLEAWLQAHADRAISGDCSDCATDAARAPCGAETAAGRCDGDVLVWCFDGSLDAVDCAQMSLACTKGDAGTDCEP